LTNINIAFDLDQIIMIKQQAIFFIMQ